MGLDGWFFWNQLGAELAVENINLNATILPSAKLQIKKFNTLDLSNPINDGYAMVQVMMEIGERHPDVVAIALDFFPQTAVYAAQVASYYKLPFCGATQLNEVLFNRNNYPYFFEMISVSAYVPAMVQLFKLWNVKRVAILIFGPTDAFLIDTLQKNGVNVVTVMSLPGTLTIETIDAVEKQLILTDSRYIFVGANGNDISTLYFTLSKRKNVVNADHVWLTTIALSVLGNGTSLFGQDYYKQVRGFYILTAGSVTVNSPQFQAAMEITSDLNENVLRPNFGYSFMFITIPFSDMLL
ncbi:UNVERIFIED_CONTAM: hypothetical protein HDU68_008443 [Siphonaria sp. JEL0065]|nr:hypothetical protein HDU68_008443 [Siphonaria sp. JEL0065]